MPISALQPYVFARADTWPIAAVYVDPSGAPIDLSGSVVTGELYLARKPLPILLTVANGGLVVDLVNGKMSFSVAPAVTEYATPDPYVPGAVPVTYAYPNRLQIVIQDTLGETITRGILPILVFDGRNIPIGAFPANGTATITAAATQGPPGPSISVNGFTGPVQNLGAHDVGTMTSQEITAAIASAVAAATEPLQQQIAILLNRKVFELSVAPSALALAGASVALRKTVNLIAAPGGLALAGGSVVAALTPRVSAPGGGPGNIADHSDPNNAYLAAMAA